MGMKSRSNSGEGERKWSNRMVGVVESYYYYYPGILLAVRVGRIVRWAKYGSKM